MYQMFLMEAKIKDGVNLIFKKNCLLLTDVYAIISTPGRRSPGVANENFFSLKTEC